MRLLEIPNKHVEHQCCGVAVPVEVMSVLELSYIVDTTHRPRVHAHAR
jgi:hypothetical protein